MEKGETSQHLFKTIKEGGGGEGLVTVHFYLSNNQQQLQEIK